MSAASVSSWVTRMVVACAQATTILVTHDETEAALMGAKAELDLGGKEGS